MPYYQYQCPKCHKDYEIELSMAEVGKKKVVCPKCGQEMNRVYSFFNQTGGKSSAPSVPVSSCPTGTCPLVK